MYPSVEVDPSCHPELVSKRISGLNGIEANFEPSCTTFCTTGNELCELNSRVRSVEIITCFYIFCAVAYRICLEKSL